MRDCKRKTKISLSDARVIYLRQMDPVLCRIIDLIGEIYCDIHDDPEQFIIQTIVGQMLSNTVASKINKRIYELCRGKCNANAIRKISREQLRATGISYQKVDYIKSFADQMSANPNFLKALEQMDDETIIKELISIKGIGTWTAKMYLLFMLQREDVVPYEDGAFIQAFKWAYGTQKVQDILKIAQRWHPYASTAARYLYYVLDSGYTKYDSIESAERKKGKEQL